MVEARVQTRRLQNDSVPTADQNVPRTFDVSSLLQARSASNHGGRFIKVVAPLLHDRSASPFDQCAALSVHRIQG